MRLRSIFGMGTLTLAVALFNLGGCTASNSSSSTSGPASTLNIQPVPASIPVNGTTTFNSNATNATGVSWTLSPNSGTISTATGYSTLYTAPATPPIYPVGSTYSQGQVSLSADTTSTNACGDAYQTISFVITAPSITAGILPTTASVALGTTLNLSAYAVGSLSNGVTVQVQGVTGGSTAYGTVVLYPLYNTYQAYQYTAPTSMPMTGATVNITVTSIADPTKSATSVITLH